MALQELGSLPAPRALTSAPGPASKQDLEAAFSDSPARLAYDPLARHRIRELLRPEYPLKRAMELLKAQPEARALFESQRHHDRLRLPSETKQFVRVLRNPVNGNLVYLIGTVHLSNISGDDVRMLIEAVRPDILALELDPTRLYMLEEGLVPPADFPNTTWEMLKYFWRVPFEKAWEHYLQFFMAQILGVEYGSDMLNGIRTARRLKIPIETIDWDFGPASLQLCFRGLGKAKSALGATVSNPDGMTGGHNIDRNQGNWAFEPPLPVPVWSRDRVEGLFSPCNNTQGAANAFERVLAAYRQGRPVPLADVAAFRSCGNQKWTTLRLLATGDGSAIDPREAQSICLDERDYIMGENLAALTEKHKKTVAVVGALHIPGIRARFAEHTLMNINLEGKAAKARARIEIEAAEKAASKQTNSHAPFGGWFQFSTDEAAFWAGARAGAILAVAGLACFKRPWLMVKFATGTAAIGGGFWVGLAALTAEWVQFGAYLDEATRLMAKNNQ